MPIASSSSSPIVCWATESVPYSGTFETGMPRRLVAAKSTTLTPVAVTATKRRSIRRSTTSAVSEALFVTTTAAPEARGTISPGWL